MQTNTDKLYKVTDWKQLTFRKTGNSAHLKVLFANTNLVMSYMVYIQTILIR